MKRNQIYKIYGTEYKQLTRQILTQSDLSALISEKFQRPASDRPESELTRVKIGIKPNLVTPTPADYGATTHPEIVAGIVEYLQENGFTNLVIMEGSWVGDRTSEAYEYCGYRELCEKYGIEFWDMQKDRFHTEDCGGMELAICDKVSDIDFMINVPVLKGHCQTKITCALKNMKGLIPNQEKRHFHSMGLHKPIAHLGLGIRQDFIVVDHICGDLDFEEGGNPVVCNCIMTAMDPVLMDSYVCKLLHYDVKEVPYIGLAEALGVGSTDLSHAEIKVLGEEKEENLPENSRVLEVSYAVEEVDSCSACYGSLLPALDRLKKEGLLEKLDGKIAIGQGFQGKRGRLGVGHCTKNFDYHVEGCPPDEDEIYQYLKSYIE